MDYSHYLKLDEWSQSQIVPLFASDKIQSIIEASRKSGRLKYERAEGGLGYSSNKPREYFYNPSTVIAWAINIGLDLPAEFIAWHDLQPKTERLPPYMDISHPMHSPELRIAIEAWEAVLKSNPVKPKKGSRKQLIETWLKTHQELKPAEINRITTMLNPDKAGGAPKTE